MKKFVLTEESKEFNGVKLFRIKALVDFEDVKAGDLGGWVEKEGNLSHQGNARVYGNAWVSGADDCIAISPIGSEDGVLTAFKNKDGTVIVNRGCFSGTIEQFEHAVNNRHGDNINGEIYRHVISILKLRLKK